MNLIDEGAVIAARVAKAREQAARHRRIDAGLECPKCGGTDIYTEDVYAPLFVCGDFRCRCSWFDLTDTVRETCHLCRGTGKWAVDHGSMRCSACQGKGYIVTEKR